MNKTVQFFIKITLLLFAGTRFCIPALAHSSQPCYLELKDSSNGWIYITWKVLITNKSSTTLKAVVGDDWLKHASPKESVSGNYLIRVFQIHKRIPENGETILIEGLQNSSLSVIVKVIFNDSTAITQLLTASQPSFTFKKETHYGVAAYVWLGVGHIWSGIDHLLFVLGLLLLLVKSRSSLFKTITAFTLAHSITLALATLGVVRVPQPPAEAIIALSIVFLALEIIRHYQGINRLTYHYPWVVAFAFGLLHGFGFAGALAEVGLPKTDIPLALLLFNAGVEIGQITFVAIVLFIAWLLQKPLSRSPVWLRRVPPYIIGSLAAYWFIERVIVIFRW